ncbi:hypothetical protein ACFV1W_30295 [Kitasatospora sp. NPDC059648]|uniref:hypothetical protein n=1 Tax=Kitasatospora sp. NPDC059648 TaxID=3346894 RepID=UPI003699161E
MNLKPGTITAASFRTGSWSIRGAAVIWAIEPTEHRRQRKVLLSLLDSTDSKALETHWEYVRGTLYDSGELLKTAGAPDTGAIWLGDVIGTYTPNDPQYNSVEIMRDEGTKYLNTNFGPEEGEPCTEETAGPALRLAQFRIANARQGVVSEERARDYLVRRMIEAKVPVERLAVLTEMSRQRIYQIRDGVR